ncbi:MAG TPA: Ig-like domain-containing protein, partial [Methylomirabilota bacterium]|nr:Ig-like domain-containing protein [Methylomirabilota bacterium]
MRLRHVAAVVLALVLVQPVHALAAGVQALFDLDSPTAGPFPSDRFTLPDPSQLTGLRVDLPRPDCGARPSDCADIDVLNTLDGFNPQPRLSVPFSGPIDPATFTSAAVFLVSVGDTLGGGAGKVVGINQVVWDPATNTAHAESDELLEQHTRYALIVTDAVRDAAGDPVEAGAFARFRHDLNLGQTHDPELKAYGKALLDALHVAGVPPARVVVASVFTTQSATAVLEKIRDQLGAATPEPAGFLLGAGGVRTVFALTDVAGITFARQIAVAGPLSPTAVPVAGLGVF